MKRITVSLTFLLAGGLMSCGPTTPTKVTCAELKCDATTQTCDDTAAVPVCTTKPAKTCADVTCGATQVCDTTTVACVEKCSKVTCSNGQTCTAATGVCANPNPPTLTTVTIDRMGRPAVNTALTNPFGLVPNQTTDQTRDAYNIDGNPATWAATWRDRIATHLGIFDSLSGTCVDQAFYNAAGANTYYAALASVLAGDAVHLDKSKAMCTAYLAVETGLPATDCGGRKLEYDVIDTTYQVLVGGTNTFTDSIAQSTATPDKTPDTTFPFMKAP